MIGLFTRACQRFRLRDQLCFSRRFVCLFACSGLRGSNAARNDLVARAPCRKVMQALSATASPSMVSCGHGGSCVGPLCSASLNASYTTQERFLSLTVLGLQSQKNTRSWEDESKLFCHNPGRPALTGVALIDQATRRVS
jgi:hypothetical protein